MNRKKCVSQNANNYQWKAYLNVLLSAGIGALIRKCRHSYTTPMEKA